MKRPMKSRIDGASFVSHSWKMERRLGCTRWQSHITLSLGPKRSSCELICQFIRQRNSHWVTRPSEIADIYSFFSPTLPPSSLSLFLCASSCCREVTYTFLILFHDSIVRDLCDDDPQEQAASVFESWRERRARYRRGFQVRRDSHDHLVFSVAQRALKLKRIPFSVSQRRLPL